MLTIAFIITWYSFVVFSLVWIASAILIFFVLLKVTAPYGRHTSSAWGPLINNRVGWFIMEIPVLIILFVIVFSFAHIPGIVSWIMLGLFCIHYINRIFIFPFRLHTKGKKIPVLIVVSAVFFNLVNGFSIGWYFTHFAKYPLSWIIDIRFITGIILFFSGMFINGKADTLLIRLRKPGDTHYVIPGKWLFEYISCPNLFGELIEWFGFALLCYNLPALSFFIWTAANLIPRALSHHKWYKKNFSNYPIQRKAIIPFVL